MITCPVCHRQNEDRVSVCTQCGHPLGTVEEIPLTREVTREIPAEVFRAIRNPAVALVQTIRTVELHIAGNPKMIVLAPTEEAVLGRRSPYGQLPDVDLSDYQAYILGVSRRHASIAVSQDSCTICDLGSANGTWINGERLRPHNPQPLKNGDEVRLGKLNIAIQIQAE